VHADVRVVRGKPTRALLAAAAEAQLVVLGSRGRGAPARALFGSTSREVLRLCPVPVVVVGPAAGDRDERPVAVAAGPLQREPLRFSSSALLRPLIQDTLLPTAAYVGGPAEISYCSQLTELYELFAVAQPLVMPRARFRCVEDNTRSWLKKLGISAADAEAPRAAVLRRFAARPQDERPTPEAVREQLLADISTQLAALETREAALREPVRRARESIERTVTRLTERYAQALLERDHVTTERVDRVQNFLYPAGMPQERFYSLPYFACKYGVQAFKQKVFACLPDAELFVPAVRDLDL